jgi:hypothetical protein
MASASSQERQSCTPLRSWPNPPKGPYTGMCILCAGSVGYTKCCAMSAALAPTSCKQGCGRCEHQLSKRTHAPSPCLSTTQKPLETIMHTMFELCGGVLLSGCRGKGAVVTGHGKPVFRGAISTPTHVLHDFTKVEHRSTAQNSVMRSLWCVQ